MARFNPVFENVGVTIFTTMSALASKHGAINLGQGFPDVDGPMAIREQAARALIEGPNQYPPMRGLESLRQALAAHAKSFYDLEYDPGGEIVVTSGATEALTASVMGLVPAGGEVVLIEPAYDSYRPIVEAIGASVRVVRLEPPHWSLTEAALAAAFTPNTKALILNSPMNPIGKVFAAPELALIGKYVVQSGAVAICDEVYEHLTFDGVPHRPLATLPGLRERCVRIGSAGKMFSLTGWKVGWVEGPADLIAPIAAAHQFITFTTPNALQTAIAHGLEHESGAYLGLSASLQQRRDLLAEGLRSLGFAPLPSQGTYFLTADISTFNFAGDDVAFCKHITEHAGVAAIPLSPFFAQNAPRHLVRFAFCKQPEVLDDALRRLSAFLNT